MKNAKRIALEAFLSVVCIIVSGGAIADAASDTSSAASEASSAGAASLEEIIVTATRREESLQRVPISVSAFSQEDLQANHITSIADLAAYTPGLQYSLTNAYSSAFTQIAIRGFMPGAGASTVGIYLDDTLLTSRLSGYTNQGNAYPFVFDLNRVEVARGPQGTLFGGGAEGGTVRFISNSPSTTDYTGVVKGEFASTKGGDPSYEGGLAFGGPIVKDNVGFRISLWDRHDGGFVDHGNPFTGADDGKKNVNTTDKKALNLAFLVQVNDDIRITPSVYYQNIYQADAPRFYKQFSDPDNGLFVNPTPQPEVWTDQWSLPSIKFEDHLPFADLTATASYMYRHVHETLDQSEFVCPFLAGNTCGNPLGNSYPVNSSQFSPTDTGLQQEAVTSEVRLNSNQSNERVNWVVGLYFDHRTQKDWQVSSSQAFFPPGTSLADSLYQDNYERFTDDQFAVFGQADIHVTDKFIVTLGERVARVHTVVSEINPLATDPQPKFTIAGAHDTPNLPKFGLSYQIDPNNLVYVTSSKGFRPGGASAQVPFDLCGVVVPTTFKSDTVKGYEMGAKDTFFAGKLQVNTSVYRYTWDDIQTFITLNCPFNYTTNLGSAITKGFELSIRGLVTPRLETDVNVAYVDAYYSDTTFNTYNGQILTQSGNTLGAPPWTVNVSANYRVPYVGNDSLRLRAEWLYVGRNEGRTFSNDPLSSSYNPLLTPDPPTHMLNLRAGYTLKGADLTLYVNNAADSSPKLSAWNNVPFSNFVSYNTFRPRTIGISVNYPF